jgi:hypothetical protein
MLTDTLLKGVKVSNLLSLKEPVKFNKPKPDVIDFFKTSLSADDKAFNAS